MKYTAEEIFDLCNEAVLKCPQVNWSIEEDDYPSQFGYSRNHEKTFQEFIAEDNAEEILLAFHDNSTLWQSGYHCFLPNEIKIEIKRAKFEFEKEFILNDNE